MILLDTSGLLSALDESQRHHHECAGVLGEALPPLLLSPFELAELDYLLMRHIGHRAQAALLEEVSRGAYQLELFGAADVGRAKDIVERYADLQIGLADAYRGAGRATRCVGGPHPRSTAFPGDAYRAAQAVQNSAL